MQQQFVGDREKKTESKKSFYFRFGMAITHQMNFGKQLQNGTKRELLERWRVHRMKNMKNNEGKIGSYIPFKNYDDNKLQIHQMKHMFQFC